MAPRFRWLSFLTVLAVSGVLAADANQACAQTLNEGSKALEGAYSKVYRRVNAFRKGEEKVDPNDKAHNEAIDLLAKTHTYTVYLKTLENETAVNKGINGAYSDFERDISNFLDPKEREALQPFAEVFRDKVRQRAWDVLDFEQAKSIHKLYNARILAKVAELGQPELADTLLQAIKDARQTDGVRYYAFRGLATLLAQVKPSDMMPVVNKSGQEKCAAALIEFLEQRKGPGKDASEEEIDGFRMLRREAIKALAQIHTPAFNDKVRPALVLARFAGSDGRIQPPPRIDERTEAVIGLARMKAEQFKAYQPDYAAGQIAKALGAFADLYNKEQKNSGGREMQTRPYKVDAGLMREALAALKTDSGKNAFVAKITNQGIGLMESVVRGQSIDPNSLSWWTSPETDAPSKELFQGAEESTVKPGQAGEATPEK